MILVHLLKLNTICLFLSLLLFSSIGFSADHGGEELGLTILKAFDGKQVSLKAHNGIEKDHPDYPIVSILYAIGYEKNGQYKKVISTLAPLLAQLKLSPLVKGRGDIRELMVGTFQGFRLWRELTYLLLGRSYYALKDYDNSIRSFKGVPSTSPFYTFAVLERFWALLGNSNYKDAIKLHQQNAKLIFSDRHQLEYKVQAAFIASHREKYKLAMDIAKEVASHKRTANSVRLAAFKVFAESGFLYWNSEYLKLSFTESVSILKGVLDFSRSIPQKDCDSECAFFVAEGWWNYASVHRVQDPVKYKSIVNESLRRSDLSLAPYVTRSVKMNGPVLSEDAYFLSIVLAWEMGSPRVAIARSEHFDKFYPVGRYQEDVYQMLGDYYFEAKQFKKALKYYRLLVKIGGTEKSTYGTYKASWSFYNLGQKWSALRHLEQILHEVHKSNRPELSNLSILNESRRDLLLFMAELLSFKQALPELKYIGLTGDNLTLAIEDLGMTYKKIGKFFNSSQVFQYLLDQSLMKNGPDPHYSSWLKELLDNKLRERDFVALESLLEKYYLSYRKMVSKDFPFGDSFYEYISSTFLLIHREAKKTDEAMTWKSLDSLYYFTAKHFYKKSSFQLLYHGAQRFESIDDYDNAIKWYRSGADKDDPLAVDSAISALRIAKTIADRSSINSKDYRVYDLLVFSTAKWFLTKYSDLPQRHIADLLYIESLLKKDKFDLINKFYAEIFKRDGATKYNIGKLNKIQGKYYAVKKWREVFFLTKTLSQLENIQGFTPSLHSKFRLVMQEAAFQNGFEIKDREFAIPWYQTAIDLNESIETTLRAWNNVLLLFSEKDSFEVIISRFNRFETLVSSLILKDVSIESQDLIYKTRLRVSSLLLKKHYIFLGHRIEFMARTDKGNLSTVRRRFLNELFLRFNSTYGDKKKFSKPKDREILRHLLLVSGNDFDTSFKSYRWKDPLALINYIDTFFQKKGHDFGVVKQEVLSAHLKGRPELQGVLSELYDFNPENYSLNIPNLSEDLLDSEVVATIKEHDKSFTGLITKLKIELKSPSSKVQAYAFCHIGTIRGKSGRFYRKLLGIVKAKFPDWKELLGAIDKKITSIDKISRSELIKCNEAKQGLSLYYPMESDSGKPLYSSNTITKYSVEDGEKLYRMAVSDFDHPLDRIHYLLRKGAVAIAELLAYSLPEKERNIGLAMIRVKLGDLRGAASLAKATKGTLGAALTAHIIKSNGGNYKAYLKSITPIGTLPEFIKNIIEDFK